MKYGGGNFIAFNKAWELLIILVYVVATFSLCLDALSNIAVMVPWLSLIEPLYKVRISQVAKFAWEATMLPGPNLILTETIHFNSGVLGTLYYFLAIIGAISVGLLFRKISKKFRTIQLLLFVASLMVFQQIMRSWIFISTMPTLLNIIAIYAVTFGFVWFWWRQAKINVIGT